MVIIGGNSCAKRLCMSNFLFFKTMLKILGKNGKVADNFWPVQDQECNLYRKILLTPQRKAIMRIFLSRYDLVSFLGAFALFCGWKKQ